MTPRTGAAALALVAGLLVAACGDDDDSTASVDDTSTSTTSTTAADTATEPEGATTSTTSATEPEGTVVDVSVTGGEVEGGGRTPVPLGDEVTIRVTSDVDDHVHLHGYDVLVDVVAGEPAELTFTADIPGVFEVELEDSRIPLLELEVS